MVRQFLKYGLIVLIGFSVKQVKAQYSFHDTIPIDEVLIMAKQDFNQPAAGAITQRIDTLALLDHISGTLSDVLSEQTPVFIKTSGRGALATASIRGSGASHTTVLWNNIPINSPMTGQVDFSLIPMYFIDELELLYGSAALQNSSGALGGSVAVTNTPFWEKGFHTKLIQSVGSYNTYSTFGQLNWSNETVSVKSRVFFESSANDYEYFFQGHRTGEESGNRKLENASYQKWGTLNEVFVKVNEKDMAGVTLWIQASNRNIPALVTSSVYNHNENQQDENTKLLAFYKHYNNAFSWELQSALINDALTYQLMNQLNDTSGYLVHFDAYNQNKSSLTQWKATLNSPNYWKFNFEIEYRYDHALTHDRKTELGYSHSQQSVSTLISAHKTIGERWSLSALLRSQWVQNQSLQPIPYVGCEYLLSNVHQVKLKTSISRNYHFPSLNDLYYVPGGNPNLIPEKGTTGELALEQQTDFGNAQLSNSFNTHYSIINHWIQWTPSQYGYWEPTNYKKVVSKGIEYNSTLGYQLGKFSGKMRFQYAYTPTTNESDEVLMDDDSRGQQLIYIPKHTGSGWVYFNYRKIEMNWLTYYLGQRQTAATSDPGVYTEPAYWLTNLSLGTSWSGEHLKLGVRGKIDNLFNVEYANLKDRPMPLRNYSILLNIEF